MREIKEIQEGNRDIIEFMGGRLVPTGGFGHINIFNVFFPDGTWFPEHYGDYHKSWNRLIPVVEKIESIHDEHHGYFGVYISSNNCTIQGTLLHLALNDSSYDYVYMSDPNAIFSTKIESTWYNVVQFIRWYNQNLKKP